MEHVAPTPVLKLSRERRPAAFSSGAPLMLEANGVNPWGRSMSQAFALGQCKLLRGSHTSIFGVRSMLSRLEWSPERLPPQFLSKPAWSIWIIAAAVIVLLFCLRAMLGVPVDFDYM